MIKTSFRKENLFSLWGPGASIQQQRILPKKTVSGLEIHINYFADFIFLSTWHIFSHKFFSFIFFSIRLLSRLFSSLYLFLPLLPYYSLHNVFVFPLSVRMCGIATGCMCNKLVSPVHHVMVDERSMEGKAYIVIAQYPWNVRPTFGNNSIIKAC